MLKQTLTQSQIPLQHLKEKSMRGERRFPHGLNLFRAVSVSSGNRADSEEDNILPRRIFTVTPSVLELLALELYFFCEPFQPHTTLRLAGIVSGLPAFFVFWPGTFFPHLWRWIAAHWQAEPVPFSGVKVSF